MKPDLLMIRFECPFCRQSIEAPEAMQFSEIICPGCARKTTVIRPENSSDPVSTLEHPPHLTGAQASHRPEATYDERVRKIRARAESLCAFSIICFVITAACIFAAIIFALDGNNISLWTAGSGGFFSLGISLQIIGQILHVRANTEK
jgi:hypothetical protein